MVVVGRKDHVEVRGIVGDTLASTVEAATFPIEKTTIVQLQAAYRAGKTTAREVTQAYLDRIASYDKRGPYLNALITVNADAAKLDATLKSTGKLVGPLHGTCWILRVWMPIL